MISDRNDSIDPSVNLIEYRDKFNNTFLWDILTAFLDNLLPKQNTTCTVIYV